MADDLQQWLNQLKQQAEKQAGRKPQSAPAKPKPAPAPGPATRNEVLRAEEARRAEEAERHRRETEARELARREQQRKVDLDKRKQLAQARIQAQIKQATNAERELDEFQFTSKKDQARRAKHARQDALDAGLGPVAPCNNKPARSNLGISGNLIHDLRHNPAALREAILLLETLGPPVAERDPMKRLF
jgi:hypothetical protein